MAVRRRKSRKFNVFMQKKLFGIFIIVVAFLILVSVFLIKINISKGDEYSKAVYNNFSYDSRAIPARRGDITDRNGTILAYSTKVYNLIIDAGIILSDDKYREPTVNAILKCFNWDKESSSNVLMSAEELIAYLDDNMKAKKEQKKPDSYKRAILQLEEEEVTEFLKMQEENSNIKGVWFEEEYKRTYPYGSFASDTMGFASESNGGELGIEKYYDSYLSGTNGRQYGYIRDNVFESQTKSAVNGNTVVTTLDYSIQNIIEAAIEEFNEEYGSESTAVLVMDPNTGEILGMADYPSFDLNNPRDVLSLFDPEKLEDVSDQELTELMYSVWSNYCVSSVYEPGSVFKTFTIAEALEEDIYDLKSVFTCDGEGVYNSATILCHGGEGHGDLTLTGALTESCNDALMQMGMEIGVGTFSKYLDVFKMGIKTGIDLPSEERGLLKDASSMMDVDLVTNTFGQNLNVTMVQMASTFASIINGGYYYEPHVVKEICSESGETIKSMEPVLVSRTISESTSSVMRSMLRAVVDYGTGGYTYIPGYSIGGKTGTAEKEGRDKEHYVLSFMGFAPAEDPEVLVYVVIDSPECEDFDSSWSAQMVAKSIFEKLLPYMGIQADNPEYEDEVYLDTEKFTPVTKREVETPVTDVPADGGSDTPDTTPGTEGDDKEDADTPDTEGENEPPDNDNPNNPEPDEQNTE